MIGSKGQIDPDSLCPGEGESDLGVNNVKTQKSREEPGKHHRQSKLDPKCAAGLPYSLGHNKLKVIHILFTLNHLMPSTGPLSFAECKQPAVP